MVRFLQTGVSLRKPENLIFDSKGTLECFCTHVTPPWRAITSRNQKKAEKREKKKRQKLGTVRLRRYLFPTLLYF